MAEMYEVKLTKYALEQLREIDEYIINVLMSIEAADSVLAEIESMINSLNCLPKRMPLVSEEPWRTEGVRKAIVKNFMIYFIVDDENKKVQVISVLYAKRNQLEQLQRTRKID